MGRPNLPRGGFPRIPPRVTIDPPFNRTRLRIDPSIKCGPARLFTAWPICGTSGNTPHAVPKIGARAYFRSAPVCPFPGGPHESGLILSRPRVRIGTMAASYFRTAPGCDCRFPDQALSGGRG
eukprot:scaffold1094_cov90-Isochrysis_galbana.AAC.2